MPLIVIYTLSLYFPFLYVCQISAVDMHKENLEAKELIRYSPIKEEQIYFQNGK